MQTLKLKCGINKFGEMTLYNLQTRIRFKKKLQDKVDEIIDQLYLSKSGLNVSFQRQIMLGNS